MSPISQVNNLSNVAASQLSNGSSTGRTSQNDNWFTDDSTDISQTITATNFFDASTTIEQMSRSILSCIGASSSL